MASQRKNAPPANKARSKARAHDRQPDSTVRIAEGGLDDPRVVALLRLHLTRARAETAPGSAHALDLSGLRSPDVRFWAAWEGESVLGCGALRRLSSEQGEVKSMHTAEAARRRGIASGLLRTLIEQARAAGLVRLYLETGSWPYFRPAVALYQAHGFTECGPFGDYAADPNSRFMTLALRPAQGSDALP